MTPEQQRRKSGEIAALREMEALLEEVGYQREYAQKLSEVSVGSRVESAPAGIEGSGEMPTWLRVGVLGAVGMVMLGVALVTGRPELMTLAGALIGGWVYFCKQIGPQAEKPDPVEELHERYATTNMTTEDFECQLGGLMGLTYTDGDEREGEQAVGATPSSRPGRASRGDGEAASS